MSIHRPSSRVVASALVSAVWAVLAACSGGGSGTVSSGNGGSSDSFVQQFCAYYQPCCQKYGFKTDGLQCRALAQLGASQGTYDPAAGSACLSEMQALSTKPDFCDSPPDPDSCDRVYSARNTGTKQPGDPCESDKDCAPSSEGKVDCRYRFNTDGGDTRTCQVQLEGKAGDTPCIGTRDGSLTSYNTKTDANRGYICDVKNGIRCDSTSNECKPLAQPGEPCSSNDSCVNSAFCDTSTTNRVCAQRLGVDADCSKNSQSCEETAYCTRDTKKCAARAPNGAACTDDDMCLSDDCLNAKCSAGSSTSSSGFSLICGKN